MKKLLFISGVAALLFLTPAASACECPPIPANENAEQAAERAKADFLKEVEKATVIFSGEVVASGLLEARFRVEKVWKGRLKDEVVIVTGIKMYADGSYSSWTCDYRGYRAGKKYVVWASGPAGGLKAHACSRTGLMEGAGQDMKALDELKASGDGRLRAEPKSKSSLPGKSEI